MKRKKFIWGFAAGLALVMAGSFASLAGPADVSAEAESAVKGLGPGSTIGEDMKDADGSVLPTAPYSGDVNELEAAKEASQLLIVIGNPADPAKAKLSWYKRGEDGRLFLALSTEAVHGMNGITAEKEEGDKKTPSGLYSFPMAFGIEEDPGSILPYHHIVEGDCYVDDSQSRYYNTLVNENEVEKDWSSAEILIEQAIHYNYGLVLNYNEERVPGKGSAIFLHCPKRENNTGTSGCISIPEEYMKELVCSVDENTRIIVAADEKEVTNY